LLQHQAWQRSSVALLQPYCHWWQPIVLAAAVLAVYVVAVANSVDAVILSYCYFSTKPRAVKAIDGLW
jgi:hypothetical protein